MNVDSLTRRNVLRAGLGAAAIAAVPPLLSACGDGGGSGGGGAGEGSLDKIREAGVVKIGVSETLPSSGSKPGQIVGIFPEITARVFKELGVPKASAVPMEFGSLIPSLQANRIDAAGGGMYVYAERCKAIQFSEPELYYLEAMAVKKGNPHNLKTYEDVAKADLDLGALTGTAEIPIAEKAGVSPSKIQKYPDMPSMFDALKADRIQAGAYDNVTIAWFVAKPAYSELESTEPYAPLVDGKAQASGASVGFHKDAGDLVKEFNKAQAKLMSSGTLQPIYEKWRVPKENLELTDKASLQELCAQ